MASPEPLDASSESALDRLFRRPCAFDFFQAVWMLERHLGGVPVGQRGPSRDERLRLRPWMELAFPSTDVHALESVDAPGAATSRYRMEVTFMGLYGVATPLPMHYAFRMLREETQAALEAVGTPSAARGRSASSPTRALLDIIHHRVLSLFYRAWIKYHYERLAASPRGDVISQYLRWLIGLDPAWTEELVGVPPQRLLRYAGLLTQRPRSASTLAGMLGDFWGLSDIRVEQFVGNWVALAASDLNRAGVMNTRLGDDLTLGEQVYDLSGSFRVRLGSLTWDQYVEFLPGAARHLEAIKLTRLYCADPLAFELELTLRAGEAQPMQLSSTAGSRLGMTTWACSKPLGEVAIIFQTATLAA